MIYVSFFALNPMNNNITLHALLSVFLHAFQRHPQNIAIFIYFHRVVAAAADALSCLPFRHSQIEVKCAPHHALHVQYRSKKKGNVFFIQISSYYYSIECISNRSEFVHVRAATSEESVKDLLQNNPSNNSHSRAMPLPLFIADKKNVHYANLIFFNCLRLLCSLVFVVVVGRKTTSCIHFFAIRKYFHFYWISSWLTEGKCNY